MPSIGSALATSPPKILIGNVPLKPCSDLFVSEDKIATAFHNSSRKTLTYIPPSVQNREVLVRPTIDMIREGKSLNTTAVGYFLGKRPYFHHLNEFVHSIWPAVRDVKATSNGFFFFQFKTMAAMEEVLEGGPWLYLGQPIVLQKWEPGMVLRKLKHTEVPIWIKLRHLPVELWTTDGLSTVASGIGKPLYPYAITRACTRLDFARVCVMLNVNSKLLKHIVIMMPNEHGGESPCKVDVDFDLCEEKPNTCPASRTGDPIPTPDPVLDHHVAKDDMVTNERPHQKTDKAPRMFPHVEHSDWNVRGPKQEDHQAAVRDLVSEFRLHLVALLETRVMPSNGLTELAVSVDLPWLVGGDFNAVLDMSEVSGASGDIRVAMHEFNDCIIQTGLISPPMQGERFSWHNCSTDGRSLWKRLDRMFVNDAWLERWPNLFYTCLTPRTSDHSPLVLKGDSHDVQHPVIGTPMYSVTRKLKALKPVFRQLRRKKGDLAMKVKLAA
ncbi:hypothetical protein Sango_3042700 [Sesamum angolense]|uniref:DUF4283 domain-containing protein n=1 Tax=Sesamum angolense TaxID=2727404 RepID=A0AAE1TAM1_9LAMI|nr:hypothetical protein Sango_3042700 [Sesamum angolense]